MNSRVLETDSCLISNSMNASNEICIISMIPVIESKQDRNNYPSGERKLEKLSYFMIRNLEYSVATKLKIREIRE